MSYYIWEEVTKLKVLLKVKLLKLRKEKQNSSLDAQDMFILLKSIKTSIPKEITKHEVGEKKGKKKAPQKQ